MNFKLDLLAENGVPFRVVFLPFGESENYPINSGAPLVEFYDKRYAHTPDGQFVSRYDLLSIMEQSRFAGLNLDGGIPAWTVDGDSMSLVRKWLNTFEILPAS
jgi:hypothetical protein